MTENYIMIEGNRVFFHQKPSKEKLEKLRKLLREYGLEFDEEVIWCG